MLFSQDRNACWSVAMYRLKTLAGALEQHYNIIRRKDSSDVEG